MGKTSSATATKGGNSISVTRNANGSYSVKSGNRTISAANATSARQAISSLANSSGGRGGWSVSSGGGSGGSSSGSYSGNTGSTSSNTGNNWSTTYANNAGYQDAVKKYGQAGVDSALDYIKNNNINAKNLGNYASTIKSLASGGSSNPNTTGNESGIGATRKVNGVDYTSSSVENFLNAKQHYLDQGMSQEDAHNKAKALLEAPTVSTTKEEENAMQYGPTEDEGYDELTGNYQDEDTNQYDERIDADAIIDEWLYNNYGLDQNSLQNTMDRLNSKDTESQVIENKADVGKGPDIDFEANFKNMIAPGVEGVGETGMAKEEPETNKPLTDVTKYQDEAISSLQSLGFLEPDTAAAESMPDTEEQAPETLAEDTPEALVQGFDEKMNELGEMGGEQGLSPKDVARTYVDYKNRLAKYIKDNNISDDQAAAMFDQLKNNEKFRNFLNANRK